MLWYRLSIHCGMKLAAWLITSMAKGTTLMSMSSPYLIIGDRWGMFVVILNAKRRLLTFGRPLWPSEVSHCLAKYVTLICNYIRSDLDHAVQPANHGFLNYAALAWCLAAADT